MSFFSEQESSENRELRAEVERLRIAVELALDLFENELVDFKKYGLEPEEDSSIAAFYRAALRGGGK